MTGVLCICKPAEITSFGVVAKVRGITRERKAGHTGTLDPMATGVLPVLLGGATRFLDYLPDSNKRYLATFRLERQRIPRIVPVRCLPADRSLRIGRLLRRRFLPFGARSCRCRPCTRR